MSTETLAGRTVLLTGASQGIGLEVLKQLLNHNCTVYAVARNISSLASLQQEHPDLLHPLALDITDLTAVSQEVGKLDGVDTLLLNAGTCEYIQAEKFDAECFARVIDVNLQGNANILQAAIPLLLKSDKSPHIVGISSLVTELPLPRSEAYGASKAGFEYLMNSLRSDLYRFGIDVTVIQPGFVKTPLTDRNDFAMPFLMSAEDAAGHVMKAVRQRRYRYRFPWTLSLVMRLVAVMPLAVILRFVQKMVPKK